MGMKTQMFIEHYDDTKEKNEKCKNYFLHQQWGYGKGLAFRLINLLNRYTMATYAEWDKGIDWNDYFKHDINFLKTYAEYAQGEDYSELSLTKLNKGKVMALLKSAENENGFLVVRIYEKKFPKRRVKATRVVAGFYEYDKEGTDIIYIPWEEYIKKYETEKSLIDYIKSAFYYFSGDDIPTLITDVLEDWDNPPQGLETN